MKRLFTTSIITLRYLVIQIQCLLRVIQITFHQGIAKRIFGTCWSCVKFYSIHVNFLVMNAWNVQLGTFGLSAELLSFLLLTKINPVVWIWLGWAFRVIIYLNPRCWKVMFPIAIRLYIWHDSIHDFIVDTGSIELYPGAELNEALLA